MTRKIAVLGSAFNPMTKGHIDVMRQASEWADLTLLIPSFKHPFGKVMLDYGMRLTMLNEGTDFLKKDGLSVKVLNLEPGIYQEGKPVYTFDVMEAVERLYPDCKLRFVCGPDNAERFDEYYKGQQVMDRWGLLVTDERCFIRSTYVREAIAVNDLEALDEMVIEPVKAFILKKGIYK